MALSINRNTNVIYVPKADLTLISGTLYELDVDAFRLELKALEDDEDGMPYSDTHRHNTEVTLAGLTYARTVEILSPYTVEFEDGQYSVSCIGANHNLSDVKVANQVSLIINNSAGLIDVNKEDIETSSYNGSIYWDSVDGTDGTGHPFGAERQPVKTQATAITRAVDRGVKKIRLVALSTTVTASPSLDGYRLLGENKAQSTVVFSSADTGDMSIQDSNFSGSMNGALFAKDCVVGTTTGVGCTTNASEFIDCDFSGNLTLRSDNTQPINIINCGSINSNQMVLDVNGTTGNISIQSYADRLKITNMTSAIDMHISSASGCELEIDSSCTAANLIEVHGNVHIINNSALTIDDDTTQKLVWESQVEGTYTAEEVINIMAAALAGKASGLNTNAPVFRDLSDTKDRITATTDGSGNRTSVTLDGT